LLGFFEYFIFKKESSCYRIKKDSSRYIEVIELEFFFMFVMTKKYFFCIKSLKID
jgi:hypothetical protein